MPEPPPPWQPPELVSLGAAPAYLGPPPFPSSWCPRAWLALGSPVSACWMCGRKLRHGLGGLPSSPGGFGQGHGQAVGFVTNK